MTPVFKYSGASSLLSFQRPKALPYSSKPAWLRIYQTDFTADSPGPGDQREPENGDEDLGGRRSHRALVELLVGEGQGSALPAPGLVGMSICCFLENWPDQAVLVVPERATGQNRVLSSERI